MIHRNNTVLTICTSLLFLLGAESIAAQSQASGGHDHSYNNGRPKTVRDLPPGQLRKDIEGLSKKAQGKALGWLQQFDFPAEDASNLRVTAQGEIHYVDTFLPQQDGTEQHTAWAGVYNTLVDPELALVLHSRPGAGSVLYLDFDGHTFTDTAWGSGEFVALPFDPSHNDKSPTVAEFTADELNRIHEIWHRVAENYAPFDIDVTTQEPTEFTANTGHLLITHDTDANGRAMPFQGSGGVAFVNVFGRSDYATRFSPTIVYYTNLSSSSHGLPYFTGDAVSHEFGHNIGLGHDGVIGGSAYYQGHGSGLTSWAPIMGVSYYKNVTQWSKGAYPSANMFQDDIAMIAADLGYASDDHGQSAALATPLLVEPDGTILVSNPELDPEDLLPYNKGVIGDRDDIDWFYFDVEGTGTVSLTATPSWHAFTRSSKRGSSLDIELSIFDQNLDLVSFADPDNDTNASVSFPVSTGRYFIQIDGVGNDIGTGYSDYASLGMYFLEGSIDVQSAIDSIPPSPATMSWQSTPHATGESSMSMTAVIATDESGSVEYYFSCVAGGIGCTDSGWQSSPVHNVFGLGADTYYAYTVKARDAVGNQNTASSPMGDTTDAVIVNQAPVAVASYSPSPVVITIGKTVYVTLDGSGSYDQDGTVSSWSWIDATGATVGQGITIGLKLREGTHQYMLTVVDNDGATDSVGLSVAVSKIVTENAGRKDRPPKG